MIELRYRYCALDKIHYYSVVGDFKNSLYFCQWVWHYLRFRPTKTIRLLPYAIIMPAIMDEKGKK